jgi:hypothetical protein
MSKTRKKKRKKKRNKMRPTRKLNWRRKRSKKPN